MSFLYENLAIFLLFLIHVSEPATNYEFTVRGFTNKREGGDSNPLLVDTDTANPSPPVISVLNCTGTVLHIVCIKELY